MVDIGELVLAAALPVVQVVLVCSAGAFARWKGILTPEGSKSIARLIYNILLPSLIVVSLGTSVTGPKLLTWWPLPANVCLNVILGLGLGAATFPFVKLPKHLWAHYVSMAGVGNLGNLLIVLVPSVARQSDDFTDDDAANGLAYTFTNLFAICIAAFCIAGPLLELPKTADHAAQPTPLHPPDSADDPPSGSSLTKEGESDHVKDDRAQREHSITAGSHMPIPDTDTAPDRGGPVGEGLLPASDAAPPDEAPASAAPPDVPWTGSGRCCAPSIAEIGGADCAPIHQERSVSTHSRWPTRHPTSSDGPDGSPTSCICMHELHGGAGAQPGVIGGRACGLRTACTCAARVPTCVHGTCGFQNPDLEQSAGACCAACAAACAACEAQSGGICHGDSPTGRDQVDGAMRSSIRGGGAEGPAACCACCDERRRCHGGPVGEGASCGGSDRQLSGAAGPDAVSAPDDDSAARGAGGKVAKWGKTLLQTLLNPPTVAIVVGIFIAVVTPLRNVMFTEEEEDSGDAVLCAGAGNGTEVGEVSVGGDGSVDRAELEVVTNALTRLGGAFLPSLLMNLGAALYQGPGGTEVSWLAIGMLMVIRLAVLPVLGTLCVLGARAAGIWSSEDRMFELVMLMQHAMPSALNLYTLAAMHGNHDKVIAAMLFWQYMVCVFTIPACVTVFLAIVR